MNSFFWISLIYILELTKVENEIIAIQTSGLAFCQLILNSNNWSKETLKRIESKDYYNPEISIQDTFQIIAVLSN